MICPRCQAPVEDGTTFCTQCGTRLAPPAPSPFKKGLFALLRALCYYFLFIGVQVTLIFIYEFAISFTLSLQSTANSLIDGNYELDFNALIGDVTDRLLQNIHIILILSALITILIVFLSFRIRRKDPLAEAHVRPISPIAVAPALVFGAALQFFTAFLLSVIPIPEETINSFNESSELLTGGPFALEFLSVVIITPIIEELIFRGLVFTRLARGMKTWLAVVLSAVIFGWAHGHIISFIYAGLLGVCLALLMKRQNDSILAPILCHAGFNGTSYLIGLLGEETSDLLLFALFFVSVALTVLCAYVLFKKPAPTASETQE